MAKIIVVEGADKVGKATQTNILRDALPKSVLVEVPTKGLTHKVIYWMLKNGLAKRLPNAFQFVQFLNKLVFQTFSLPKLLRTYDYVILDRWALSGLVYGEATGVNDWFNNVLYMVLRKPDITIIMTGTSFKRGKADDVYEKDSDLQTAVKARYWSIGTSDGWPGHELLYNGGTREEVFHRVLGVLVHAGIIDSVDAPWGHV